MDSKLTLKLDNQVIMKAKSYAKTKKTSLSKLIEGYLSYLTSLKESDEEEVTPVVKSISGVLDEDRLDDFRKSYKQHVTDKYAS